MTEDCPIVQCIESEYYVRNQIDQADPLNTKANILNKPLRLVPHHKRILNRMFADIGEFQTYVFSAPKASAKTEVAAAITYAFLRLYGGEAFSVANDKEQAEGRLYQRVWESLKAMKEVNPALFRKVIAKDYQQRIQKNGVIEFADNAQVNPGPHFLKYIANDYAGESGAQNSWCAFDEIWGIMQERGSRLWTEMQPKASVPVSKRFVSTYAGFYGESQLLYGIYENVVKPDPNDSNNKLGTKVIGLEDLPVFQEGDYIVYWDNEPRMPWHTPEKLESARIDPSNQGRESEYLRLWRNEWSTGLDPYLSIEVINALMARGEAMGLRNQFQGVEHGT